MTIYIGADHRGFFLKEQLKPWLGSLGHKVIDCGNSVLDPQDDFPDFSFAVGDNVTGDPASRGIILCGSAGGVMIAANKVRGIRCVSAGSVVDVKHNRDHNDTNILAIAAESTPLVQAKEFISTFIDTDFLNEERMVRRLNKIKQRES